MSLRGSLKVLEKTKKSAKIFRSNIKRNYKLLKLYLTQQNSLIVQDSWQVHHEILLII